MANNEVVFNPSNVTKVHVTSTRNYDSNNSKTTYDTEIHTTESVNNISTLGSTFDPNSIKYTPTETSSVDYSTLNADLYELDSSRLEYFKELLKLITDMANSLDKGSTDEDTSYKTDIKYVDPDVITRNVKVDTMEYTVTGDGLFDILMDTATKHIKAQFDANRIRQEDYANAYLEIYKVTLQAALQAWTTAVEYEHKKAEVEMVKAQTRLVLLQALGEMNKPTQILAQIRQIESQITHQNAQTDLVKAQIDRAIYENKFLVPKQIDEADAKVKTQVKQVDVLEAQTALVSQQVAEEKAKELLYLRQREGFDESFNKEVLKTMIDGWTVAYATAGSAVALGDAIPKSLNSENIDSVFKKVYAQLNGVDITDQRTNKPESELETPPYTG